MGMRVQGRGIRLHTDVFYDIIIVQQMEEFYLFHAENYNDIAGERKLWI